MSHLQSATYNCNIQTSKQCKFVSELYRRQISTIPVSLDADGLQKLSIIKQLREQYKEAALSAKKEGDKVIIFFSYRQPICISDVLTSLIDLHNNFLLRQSKSCWLNYPLPLLSSLADNCFLEFLSHWRKKYKIQVKI